MSVKIIAEVGVNHNGDLEVAKELVEKCSAAGADIVKFQTFTAGKLVTRYAPKAEYQIASSGGDELQYDMLARLELSKEMHVVLKVLCETLGTSFLSTAFDTDSLDFLAELGLDIFKIPSGEITNFPLLSRVAALGKPLLLSTGMANISEVGDAISILNKFGACREDITVLHCNTEYPSPFEDVNLRAMLSLSAAFGVSVGYSDHTAGIEVPIAAVALGAKVIEKHVTLDRSMPGPDHLASLEINEFRQMVDAIRNVEKCLGNGIKEPSQSELKNIPAARKSIVASRDIKKGEVLTSMNLTTKRPGLGISPMRWMDVIGRKACKDFVCDEFIRI